MATEEVRRLRHQMASKVREYEGHLMRLEGQLLVLRARVDRAAGEAVAGLASLLAQTEREVEVAREVGRAALAGPWPPPGRLAVRGWFPWLRSRCMRRPKRW